MNNELVSVVIPTYNRVPNIVVDAINSVKKQTYSNIEIIIVDDNGEKNISLSNDIEKTISSIDGVRYIKHDKNQGACVARNTGIMAAQGEFVAFLDDDDEWMPTKTERQVELFNDSDVGLVYCGIQVLYEDSGKTENRYAVQKDNSVVELLKHNYIGSTSCGIARKNVLIDCGLFDTRLKSGQDQDMWVRIAQKYKVACVDECLIVYKRSLSPSISRTLMNRLDSNLYLRKKYDDIYRCNLGLRFLMFLKIIKAFWVNGMKKESISYIFGKRQFPDLGK